MAKNDLEMTRNNSVYIAILIPKMASCEIKIRENINIFPKQTLTRHAY